VILRNSLAPEWLTEPRDLNAISPKIWPRTVSRNSKGELEVGGVGVGELASRFGTPLYVIDQDDFESRLLAVKRAFVEATREHGSTAKVYYASKAFLSADVASWVEAAGLNLDVASGGELALALAAGFPPERMGLHGNNKSLVEIGRAVSSGIGAIVIDSEIEIERIASIAAAQDRVQAVRLRVNTGVHAETHEYLATAREDQKFGIALSDVPALVAKIRSHSHLKFIGLHCHIGSQIFGVEGFIAAADRLLTVHSKLLEGGDIAELNLGGGFGIAYTPNDNPMPIEEMAQRIVRAVAQRCTELGISVPVLAFEPGRVIAGPATFTLYNVGTTKDVVVTDAGPAAARRYVSVDGGMSDNIRAALYRADYTPILASRVSGADANLVRVVGKHCESGDIVVRDGFLQSDVAPNDLIAVAATGAYCHSLSSNYNFLTRPPVVAVKAGRVEVLIRGETEVDLLARDQGLNRERQQ
jgi:diaminopimelate decarboxylase